MAAFPAPRYSPGPLSRDLAAQAGADHDLDPWPRARLRPRHAACRRGRPCFLGGDVTADRGRLSAVPPTATRPGTAEACEMNEDRLARATRINSGVRS